MDDTELAGRPVREKAVDVDDSESESQLDAFEILRCKDMGTDFDN